MWTPGHLDMWCLATLAASWKRNIQKVMEWWWQFWNGACFRTFKLPWNVYRVSKADGHIYVRIWCIWYHSACSLSPHTQNATLTLHWAPILWMCWTDPRSNCNLQSWTKGRLKPAHMWSHDLPFAHESYEFMIELFFAVNLRNSTERNSMQRKHWMDVDSLNLDYFLLVRFRDYVLCCQIALFKSFKSLRLQNPTTLQRPMFRFFNA